MVQHLFLLTLGLFVVDAALREWRPAKEHLVPNAAYLAVAYAPLLALPHLAPFWATFIAAAIALVAFVSFGRMVGLTNYPRYFVPALVAVAAFFAAAHFGRESLLSALPVYSVLLVVGAATTRGDTEAFLQKMCLSWVGLLVFGYLWAHAPLLARITEERLPGVSLLVAVIFAAKAGDVAWVAVHRLVPKHPGLQLIASPVGGALGGVLLFGATAPAVVLGLVVGLGLGLGSRAHDLVVRDVLGAPADRPLKGTMLFGFAFALALAYQLSRTI